MFARQKSTYLFFSLFLIPMLLSAILTAETIIPAGDVSGIWRAAKSPYIIQGRVTVAKDSMLIIQPGVTVKFDDGASLNAYKGATLEAKGTADSLILFTSSSVSPSPGIWNQVYTSGTKNNCQFTYCIFEYATTGLVCYAWARSCESSGNNTTVQNCLFRKNVKGLHLEGEGDSNYGCAPSFTGVCDATVESCRFEDNSGNAIYIASYNGYYANGLVTAKIYRNIIYKNGENGIYCRGTDPMRPRIINNTIVGNGKSGVSYEENSTESMYVINNIIALNETGIENRDSTMVSLSYNNVWNNVNNYTGIEPGEHDISVDPMFEDMNAGDLRLAENSPCINSGDPSQPPDPDGSNSDIGACPPKSISRVNDSINDSANPETLSLEANYPNPFNSSTKIVFSMREAAFVNISIFNLQGKRVATLVDDFRNTGTHTIQWHGVNSGTIAVPSGIYFCRLQSGDYSATIRMHLLR